MSLARGISHLLDIPVVIMRCHHGTPHPHEAFRLVADANRRTVLQRLIIEGDETLQLLAASAGTSRRAVLARVLGEAVVQEYADLWESEKNRQQEPKPRERTSQKNRKHGR